MSVLTDSELVLRWAVWDVRRGDVPAGIAEALERLAPVFPREDRPPRSTPYSEGRYRVSVFPDNDGTKPMIQSRPLDVAGAIADALGAEPLYVLVCDLETDLGSDRYA